MNDDFWDLIVIVVIAILAIIGIGIRNIMRLITLLGIIGGIAIIGWFTAQTINPKAGLCIGGIFGLCSIFTIIEFINTAIFDGWSQLWTQLRETNNRLEVFEEILKNYSVQTERQNEVLLQYMKASNKNRSLMEQQYEELLQLAQSWREEARSGNSKLIQLTVLTAKQAEGRAKEQREHEKATQNMLDNIQYCRKPDDN